jgi:ABC-type lipoprotein release transport system permease subunit
MEKKAFNAATYSMSHLFKERARSLTMIVTISLTVAFLLLTSSLLFGVISEIQADEREGLLQGRIPGSLDMFEQFQLTGELSEKAKNSLVNYLLITSLIVFIVAFFIMYNTMAISVRERRKEIGILRAVGFSTGEVLKLFLVEGGMIGFISWLSALFLGTPLIVNLAAYMIERGDQGLFFVQPVIPFQLVVLSLIATLVLAIGSTYLATIGPVRSSPVAMMRNG